MKRRTFFTACCALLFATSALAQAGAASATQLAGTWKGSMGTQDERGPIQVELKSDPKTGISGTITGPPYPGDIKSGTFDPTTGALKLEVIVRNDDATKVTFEGTAVEGTATGRVSFNGQIGTFIMTKAGGAAAAATQPSATDAGAALRKSFAQVSGWVTKSADLVAADKFSYRPTQSVRTFGELIGHIADSYTYFCATASGQKVQWSDAIEKGSTDKATLIQKLRQSTEACNAAYSGSSDTNSLVSNIGHINLHYGNIITYMRMMGLTPPSS